MWPAHAALALARGVIPVSCIIHQALAMCCFAPIPSSRGTLAMEQMAHIAGTASSVRA